MSIQSLFIFLLFPLLSSAFTQTSDPFNITHQQNSNNPAEISVIEGMVYCQNCAKVGSWSLSGTKTLPLSKIGIVCRDEKNRVWFYRSFQADGNGYFYAVIDGFGGVLEGGRKTKREVSGCRVHLLSSADGNCNILTNINLGISGAKVGEGKRMMKKGGNYEVVLYAFPPLAFRPAICPYYTSH